MPITAASNNTVWRTCRPLAPAARSSANSRVRCVTVMAKVLSISVLVAGSGDPDVVRAALDGVTAGYRTAIVRDYDEFRAAQTAEIGQLLAPVFALRGPALLIALLGITNTSSLSVMERTREMSLLRAVGMSRPQLSHAVRWEAVFPAGIGALVGLALGVFAGWSAIGILAEEENGRLVIPVLELGLIGLAAAVLGVLASLLPARRAARLGILDGLARE